MFNNSFCYRSFSRKKNGEKSLILDSTEKYEKVWSGIKSEIKKLNSKKELFYEKKICKSWN